MVLFRCVSVDTLQPSRRISMRGFFYANQDAETVLQRRSRIVQILNVPQRVRFRSSLAAALLDRRFEQPAAFLVVGEPCQIEGMIGMGIFTGFVRIYAGCD